jgi:hypothetical protein
MDLNFIEVTLINGCKYSFRIERLNAFRYLDINKTRIFLNNNVDYDINESYDEFLNRIKKI